MWLTTYGKSFVCLKESSHPDQIWFCFHFVGGTASMYFPWANLLPDGVLLYAAQLPGRGERIAEPFLQRFADVIEEYVQLFSGQKISLPFVFFGHSMGGLLAYEILAKLVTCYNLPQGYLAVSACKPPHRSVKVCKTSQLDDACFIEKIKQYGGTPAVILEDQTLLQFFLPRLRADTILLENYSYQPKQKLPIPILAFGGTSDKIVTPNDMSDWKEYTNSSFSGKHYPGGHFYLKEAQHQIISDILQHQARLTRSYA